MKSTMTKSLLGAMVGASLMLAGGVVSAAKPDNSTPLCERVNDPVANSCNAEFQLLYADIKEAWSDGAFTSQRATMDCNGIITKVDNAVAKVNATPPKYSDAERKLSNIISTVGTLSGDGKLVQVDTDIAGAALEVQKCLPGGIE